jgi:DNA-binding IclR family transcriptional regulator
MRGAVMKSTENVSSTAVLRALAILEAVAQRNTGLTNSEISRRLEIPKSSASYLLRTLEQAGYLRREQTTGKYRLGLKVLGLGSGVEVGGDLKDAARPVLKQLVERSRLTAHVAVLDHGEAVYIERVDSPGFIKMDTWVGRRMEINATGVGKALVAYLPSAEVEAIIKKRGLRKRTPKTIISHARFLAELARVRERGYAIDDEENSLGARCIAAPVFDHLGRVAAAVGVSGSTGQVNRASVKKIAEMVRAAALKISHHLGYRQSNRK